MKFKAIFIFCLALFATSCKTPTSTNATVQVSSDADAIQWRIVEMNSVLDANPNKEMSAFIEGYKELLDDEMNQVIGTSDQLMPYAAPESLLTNLTSDVLKAYGDEHLPGGADVAFMNVHGHRSMMPKGEITVGNMFEIYSFDNTVTYVWLKGRHLKQILYSYARMGGAGISGNARLYVEDKHLKSATIDGSYINDDRVYKIVTIDYLADGNNGMQALRDAEKMVNTGVTLRDAMIDYVKEQTRAGRNISSSLDGRIIIK